MSLKQYKLAKTAKKIAKDNNLVYSGHNDVYYDVSVFDKLVGLPSEIKELCIKELMEYNRHSWFEQPIPIESIENRWTTWHANYMTSWQRFYRVDGRRIIVIVCVNEVTIAKWTRQSIYDEYHRTEVFQAENGCRNGDLIDIEVA